MLCPASVGRSARCDTHVLRRARERADNRRVSRRRRSPWCAGRFLRDAPTSTRRRPDRGCRNRPAGASPAGRTVASAHPGLLFVALADERTWWGGRYRKVMWERNVLGGLAHLIR